MIFSPEMDNALKYGYQFEIYEATNLKEKISLKNM
jgi:hypothetical protein